MIVEEEEEKEKEEEEKEEEKEEAQEREGKKPRKALSPSQSPKSDSTDPNKVIQVDIFKLRRHGHQLLLVAQEGQP